MKWINTHKAIRKLELETWSDHYSASMLTTSALLKFSPSSSSRVLLGSRFRLLLLFVVVQSLSHVQLFSTPWTAAHQASLPFFSSWSLFRFMSVEWVLPSNHLILCCPLLLLPSSFPSIRVFSHESASHVRWPKVLELQHQSVQWIFRLDFL